MRKECADIVFDAVVVGSSRTHPVLIVESEGSNLTESRRRQIAAQIVDKTANTNQGMFPYERIKDPAWIIVLEKGSLPRTKVCRMIITHLREDPPSHSTSCREQEKGNIRYVSPHGRSGVASIWYISGANADFGAARRNATEEVFKAQIDAVFDAQSQLDGKCIGFF